MPDATDRRQFVKLCGATAVLAAANASKLSAPVWAIENAPRARLVGKNGEPIKAADLKVHENHVFHYPYASTPCLLIRLDEATPLNIEVEGRGGATYSWPGGVGRDGAVVSYSAICAHAFTYDSKETSFMNYAKARSRLTGHGRVITCCAHGSVYDPAGGARVLAGPAKFPLAAVALEHDQASDGLTAVGMVGSELFKEFFKTYKKDLRKEFGRRGYRKLISDKAVVMTMKDFTEDIISC